MSLFSMESFSGLPGRIRDLTDSIFRSNPTYQLVLFDRLSQKEKEVLSDLLKDPHFYGILRSNTDDLGMKSVCCDTALLFFTMMKPGKIPTYAKNIFGHRFNEVVCRLVLDRILEIKLNNKFISGTEAYEFININESNILPNGVVNRLSIDAMKYGQSLQFNDYLKLSVRLYFYNRIPVSTQWKSLFSSEKAIIKYLGLEQGGKNKKILDKYWGSPRLSSVNNNWRFWTSNKVTPCHRAYKLYVSPRCEHISETFGTTLEVLTELKAPSFKIGKDVYGLLRPDKMIAYFTTFDEMSEVAAKLLQHLQGIPAHGVPFTASFEPSGLLSWGMDPPRQQHILPWQGPSWRRWITDRLSVSLITAKASTPSGIEPWQFALERLRLEGIDTTSWIPSPEIWIEEKGGINNRSD